LLVTPGRADALAEAMARLVGDPDRRRAMAAAALARSADFDVERSARAMEATYERIAGGRPSPASGASGGRS
jgi:glycosyltransferase involved in cell wall biosynthesis